MKLEIYGEAKAPVEKVLRLKLFRGEEGEVILAAVDECGGKLHLGNLLEINPNGRLYLRGSISKNLGLRLNSMRELEV